jgi:glycosyltransferase involved in cell wall biosynthesis
MDFTVAICTWNRADLLAKTLECLSTVAVPPGSDWEVLVVNNRSTDHTERVIGSFAGRLPIRGLFEERQGQSAARNLVLRTFKGERLIFTDDDVQPDPEWILQILNTFDQQSADVVFGPSRPVWLSGAPAWFGPQFAGQFALLDYGTDAFIVSNVEHQFYGVNVAFTRGAAAAVGYYREDVGLVGSGGGGGDDTDIFQRCLAKGLRVVYQPKAVVGHMIPPDRITKQRQRQLAWRGGRSNYQLNATGYTGPKVLGVPRFHYLLAARDAAAAVTNALRGNAAESFYRQIRVIRFAALVREGLRA